ncbi:MFS transporter [Streptomyces sp. NPDC102360]|uniref:MFS transporter n=1 Tax=Streptomyces sp. NPDC102360 TaxID=3366160 RepID=UPI00382EEFD6
MTGTSQAAALGARLDRLPLSPFHRRLVLALAGMILFEWVETYAFAFVAPALRAQWGLSLSAVAVVAGVSSLGAFAGGIFGGYLADRVGRRRTLLICVSVYCTATALCIVVQNPWQLIVARCTAHFGAQGMAVVAIVVLTEFVPAAARGRLQTYKVAVGSLGPF